MSRIQPSEGTSSSHAPTPFASVKPETAAAIKKAWGQQTQVKWFPSLPIGPAYVRVTLVKGGAGDMPSLTALIPVAMNPFASADGKDPNKAGKFLVEYSGGLAGITKYAGPFSFAPLKPYEQALVKALGDDKLTKPEVRNHIAKHYQAMWCDAAYFAKLSKLSKNQLDGVYVTKPARQLLQQVMMWEVAGTPCGVAPRAISGIDNLMPVIGPSTQPRGYAILDGTWTSPPVKLSFDGKDFPVKNEAGGFVARGISWGGKSKVEGTVTLSNGDLVPVVVNVSQVF